jgi:hypothetical protein
MALFSISPVNSLSFVKIDTNKENYTNTVFQNINKSFGKTPYNQMINNGDILTIQIKTDYSNVTAWLYNILTGTITSLSPAIVTTYTDFSFWEIPITFTDNGFFKMFISATLSGVANKDYVSEVIEVRDSWDDQSVVNLQAYNNENTGEVDYSTGIVHFFNVYGLLYLSDIGGNEEFYNNFGIEERTYAENQTIYELSIEGIPYYLCRQIIYCSKLDRFFINGIEFIIEGHTLIRQANSYMYDLILKVTQKQVEGIAVYTDFGLPSES